MALRLLEMVLQEKDGAGVRELLNECKVLEHRQIRLADGEVLVRILLDAEQSETVLDLLEKRYTGAEGNRVVILPVEATLPRDEPEEPVLPNNRRPRKNRRSGSAGRSCTRTSRSGARLSRVYMAMVVLSTVVAAIGLYYNSVAIIIGAMVIAPLLGPNVALSLGTTLGDLSLLRHGLLTSLAGIAAAMVLSVIIGVLLQVDPASSEDRVAHAGGAGRHRGGIGVGQRRRAGVHDRRVGDFDRRHGGGGVVAAAGDVRAAAGRWASDPGNGRVVAVSGEPDLREPCRRDDVSAARHQADELVGEGSGRESHAHRHCAVGGPVGGVGRHDPAGAQGLKSAG